MQGGLTCEVFMTGLIPAFAINFVLGSYIPLLSVNAARIEQEQAQERAGTVFRPIFSGHSVV